MFSFITKLFFAMDELSVTHVGPAPDGVTYL